MSKIGIFTILIASAVIPAAAQTTPADPVSTWLRNLYNGNKNNILRTAEKMPEENYGLRPGPQEEVRTFGQQVGHVANFNFLWCSQARGEKNPHSGENLEKLPTKAELIKALTDAFAYCDAAYNSLTDVSGAEMVEITQENGRQNRIPRTGLLTLNYGHNNEIYGSMVIFLRMKGITPPASEPRQGASKK